MALSELSRQSLHPSFLYSAASSFTAASSPTSQAPVAAPTPAFGHGTGGGRPFSIQSPNEKIKMYSPAFYAACSVGGIASCGLTHMAVTPLDLVKCNMQVNS
ncbi:unnamed protein product [Triticum turgidum subsp. durum]|uniref:Uncharacterized protein n=1 Tax=Triticum turgidum subsp. durum TaxID=4567 RepID=A0A9R1Q8B6_TRITD|nr:unnamed protein product [Triticum turgidum subsp. durum]